MEEKTKNTAYALLTFDNPIKRTPGREKAENPYFDMKFTQIKTPHIRENNKISTYSEMS